MKQQTTISFLKNYSLKILISFFMIITSFCSNAQLLFANGPISSGSTHLATSTGAPAGYTWSELQTPASSLGFSVFYNNALTTNISLSEDFVVPVGQTWNLTNVNVYGYQTNYAGATVPIDVLRIRIWNGDPSLGTSTVVYGDMTTNVLSTAGSGEEFIYRVATTTGTARRVWRFNAAVSISLPSGTYWFEYQVHAINDGSVFVPPVTILNVQSDPSWNAKQRTATTWASVSDVGSASTKSIPFQLIGSTLGLNSNELVSGFKMYPVPAKDICNFIFNEKISVQAKSVRIYDLKGALVFNENVLKNDSDFSINISNMQSGIYLVKIIDVEGKPIFTDKLIKE